MIKCVVESDALDEHRTYNDLSMENNVKKQTNEYWFNVMQLQCKQETIC